MAHTNARIYNGPNRSMRPPVRKIAVGDLNKRIEIQERVLRTKFSTGTQNEADFKTIIQTWAALTTVRGSNSFDDVEQEKPPTHCFFIRYRPNIDQTLWILYKNKRYEIISTENYEERDEYLMLICRLTGTSDADNEAARG